MFPDIHEVFNIFPKDYINDINGWGFDEKTIEQNRGNLLTLDIDFGNYCSLNCPYCFRSNNSVDIIPKELTNDKLIEIILEAKTIGLRSVKFLGKGDPFENKGFLDFLRFLHSENIIPLIFTKGQVIGDNTEVEKYFGKYDIKTSVDLAKELKRLNASIMLGFNSCSDKKQNLMVGDKTGNYSNVRNNALVALIKAKFNEGNPTSLALAVNPVTKQNIDEAFEIYKWARTRNIYCVVTPTMVSGLAKNEAWKKITPPVNELVELYSKIYKFNIESGIQTKEQIIEEGISAYAGGHPCNQVACGMYLTLYGVVLSCPGNEENVEGNIYENSIKEIWNNSNNRLIRSGKYNCSCIAKDGKSIPAGFYDIIMKNILYGK